jgi:hypothetical protein
MGGGVHGGWGGGMRSGGMHVGGMGATFGGSRFAGAVAHCILARVFKGGIPSPPFFTLPRFAFVGAPCACRLQLLAQNLDALWTAVGRRLQRLRLRLLAIW